MTGGTDAGTDEGDLEVRIVGGGDPGPEATAAIIEAIRRTLPREDGAAPGGASSWALAGRLEAAGRPRIASRAALLLR